MNALRISYNKDNVVEYDLKNGDYDFTNPPSIDKALVVHLKTGVLILPPAIWGQCIIEFFEREGTK